MYVCLLEVLGPHCRKSPQRRQPPLPTPACAQGSGAVYGLLLAAGGQVVAVERAKGAPSMDHRDLLLLDNFICCNPVFRCVRPVFRCVRPVFRCVRPVFRYVRCSV